MGTWGVHTLENDTSADVYWEFVEFVEAGMKPKDASDKVRETQCECFEHYIFYHDAILALGQAQWEYGVLEPKVYNEVKRIVEGGHNLEYWRVMDYKEEYVEKRKVALDAFLEMLGTENKKVKKRKGALARLVQRLGRKGNKGWQVTN